jgi:pimeloyl-ACP methyl ester carboxylesterase
MSEQASGQYAQVNGLNMYYETHGEDTGTPLVLLHGAFSATGTSWGALLDGLARDRRVICVELQGHGHTADVDRPLRIGRLAADTSMSAAVALVIGLEHPEKTRKLVPRSFTYHDGGYHPGHLDMMGQIQPETLHGSPFHDEYVAVAPRPADFDALAGKVKEMVEHVPVVTDEAIKGMAAPVLTILGDSDIVRPEHAVELFRLTGGGVNGDLAGLPNSQLAVVPAFLDAPVS